MVEAKIRLLTTLDEKQNMELINDERDVRYAGFWIRFIAYFIDGLVIYFIFTILITIFTGDIFYTYRMNSTDFIFTSDYWSITSANFILTLMYYSGLESSSKQATLGKMLMGIKVTDLNGERITPLRAIGRYLSKIISAIILLLGYIMAAFDRRKQALHDKIAETLVVYDNKDN